MTNIVEAFERIDSFSREAYKTVGAQRIELGEVDPGVKVVYGAITFPRRLIGVPGEPRLHGTTMTGPVVALEVSRPDNKIPVEVIAIAYETDAHEVGADLITKVVDRLAAVKLRKSNG